MGEHGERVDGLQSLEDAAVGRCLRHHGGPDAPPPERFGVSVHDNHRNKSASTTMARIRRRAQKQTSPCVDFAHKMWASEMREYQALLDLQGGCAAVLLE